MWFGLCSALLPFLLTLCRTTTLLLPLLSRLLLPSSFSVPTLHRPGNLELCGLVLEMGNEVVVSGDLDGYGLCVELIGIHPVSQSAHVGIVVLMQHGHRELARLFRPVNLFLLYLGVLAELVKFLRDLIILQHLAPDLGRELWIERPDCNSLVEGLLLYWIERYDTGNDFVTGWVQHIAPEFFELPLTIYSHCGSHAVIQPILAVYLEDLTGP